MPKIINYCSGGLGNRLKPLLSSMCYANKTNRDFSICWNPFMRCRASFNDLFFNGIPNLPFSVLENLEDVVIYSNSDAADYECELNKTDSLQKLYRKYPIKPISSIKEIHKETCENIIIFSNQFLNGITREENRHAFQKLIPITKINKMVKDFPIKLDKKWIGCHIRGTDFNLSVDYYFLKLFELYKNDSSIRFFICSDSREYEAQLKSSFPTIEFREKINYVSKGDNSKSWNNNVESPIESIQEALVDLYLLSKTDIKIFHPNSTFADLALTLS